MVKRPKRGGEDRGGLPATGVLVAWLPTRAIPVSRVQAQLRGVSRCKESSDPPAPYDDRAIQSRLSPLHLVLFRRRITISASSAVLHSTRCPSKRWARACFVRPRARMGGEETLRPGPLLSIHPFTAVVHAPLLCYVLVAAGPFPCPRWSGARPRSTAARLSVLVLCFARGCLASRAPSWLGRLFSARASLFLRVLPPPRRGARAWTPPVSFIVPDSVCAQLRACGGW